MFGLSIQVIALPFPDMQKVWGRTGFQGGRREQVGRKSCFGDVKPKTPVRQ